MVFGEIFRKIEILGKLKIWKNLNFWIFETGKAKNLGKSKFWKN